MAILSRDNENGGEEPKRPDESGAEAAPQRSRAVGQLLREARQGFGRDLAQIGAALRIRSVYLQAIEEGRYEELPGPTYAIGFIRTYADYLGLDSAELVRRFKEQAAGLELKRDLSFPMPITERSVPGGTILLLGAILAICGYGIWYYLASSERTRPERVGAVPAALLTPPAAVSTPTPSALAPAAAETNHPTEAAAAPPTAIQPAAPLAPAPQPPAAALPALPAQVASAPAAGDQAVPTGDLSHVFGMTTAPVRIVIRATSDSWIQVRDGEQNLVFTRLMRAGDVYRVPDKAGLWMRTGNAGGLEVTVDGKPAPSLGNVGILRRNVALDAKRLAAGEAVAE